MRVPFALAIYVFLATGSFAESPATKRENAFHSNEEAIDFYQRSWENSGTAAQRAASATGLGNAYHRLGNVKEAKAWLERARQELNSDPYPGSGLAAVLSNLADMYRTTGDYAGAERLLREGAGSPSIDPVMKGMLRNNLADLLREEGRSTEARALFEEPAPEGAEAWRQRVGALIGLADIDRQLGNWEASIDQWNAVLDICRREHDRQSEAIALHGLGMTWLQSGRASRAGPLLRLSLRMMENNPDTPPEEVAAAHSGLGELYRSENKLALAEDEWSRALQINRAVLGEAHPQAALLMAKLADVYSARGEFSLAREYGARASQALRGAFGENSMSAATAVANQAVVEERAGDFDAATKDYDSAMRIARGHPEYRAIEIVIIQRYAGLLKAMHRPHEAKALLARGFSPPQGP
jgi:tetratricopeptide (TPR) repeat protein